MILDKYNIKLLKRKKKKKKTLISMRVAHACGRQARACVFGLFEQWLLF